MDEMTAYLYYDAATPYTYMCVYILIMTPYFGIITIKGTLSGPYLPFKSSVLNPKSANFRRFSDTKSTFSALMSRWTYPRLCWNDEKYKINQRGILTANDKQEQGQQS